VRSRRQPALLLSQMRAAVCRFGGIGDQLVASSVLPLLANDYTVDVITNDSHHVLFENNPFVDRLIKVRREEWQEWFVRRSHEYDKFVHLSHSMEATLALTPDQTPFWWADKPRRMLCGHNYLERTHDICEVPHVFDPGPRFYPTEEEFDRAAKTKAKMGSHVIGWSLSGSRIDKVYDKTAITVARLIREIGLPVCMFGSPGKDFDMAKQIMADVEDHNGTHDGLHLALSDNLETPNWPIRRALTQALTCDIMVGPDTGIMWSVAFEDMPKVMLLSHASALNITKHWLRTVTLHADQKRVPCWPCHRLISDWSHCTPNAKNTGAACITSIPVEAIVSAVKASL
jgi:ADP-heptose:LPS heptosyltransferase